MKKHTTNLFIIFSLFLISACSDNNAEEPIPQNLEASSPSLSFGSGSEIQKFTVISNGKWEITTDKVDTWFSINPIQGIGNAEVSVNLDENKTQEPRSVTITIKTSSKAQTVSIRQEATPKVYHYFPLVTITTTNNAPIVSKDEYLDATLTIQGRTSDGGVGEKLLEVKTEIKGRGNSTWGMDKKPYRLKFDKSNEVLGMPKNKHWVLLANYSDKTLMRNELAFEISRRMGFAYTPRSQHVDVILNGAYIGNYMLCEHIRIDKERVNITEMKATASDVTGGYLLEIDERRGEPVYFETKEAKMTFCVNRPEDIPNNQKEYISTHIQKLEDALYGKLGSATTEAPKYLDLKTFIDYYLLNEISKNVDGNLRLSTFCYKDKGDDKIYFGPAWDYDIAFGNVDYDDCWYTSGWHARKAVWYQKFFSHNEFKQKVNARWKELRAGELSSLAPFIDDLAEKMEQSQKRNFSKWNILNKYVWPNKVLPGTYQGEINYLKSWIEGRMIWMDGELK